jgi:hypothetical protein
VASRRYGYNDISRAGDDRVTAGIRVSVSVHGESDVETPILSIVLSRCLLAASSGGIEPSFRTAIVSKTSARSAAFGRDSRLTMRLLVHVLARLAITATCTNSAAALDVQAGSPEMSFTSNLSEYPMLNSQSAIAAVRRYGTPG